MIKIKEVAFHRNGCFGEGFHAVRFVHEGAPMIGIVFEGEGRVAVLNAEMAPDTVAFGVNSWRCEEYETALRVAVANYEGIRAGISPAERFGHSPATPERPAPVEALSESETGHSGNVIPLHRWKQAATPSIVGMTESGQ